MEIRALFWDVDDTVLDFEGYVKETMRSGFREFGLPDYEPWMFERFTVINSAIWRELEKGIITFDDIVRDRWNRIFEDLGFRADGPAFETYFRHQRHDSGSLMDGARETLSELAALYPMYVASNGPAGQQENRLVKAGVRDLFRGLFTSGGFGVSKPSEAFFDCCFRQIREVDGMDLKPEEVLMIGDSLTSDMDGAIRYGLRTCLYDPKDRHGSCCMPIDLRVQDLREIPGLLAASGQS